MIARSDPIAELLLARISYQLSTAELQHHTMTALRSIWVLNVLKVHLRAQPLRVPCHCAPLRFLATKPGDKCRLARVSHQNDNPSLDLCSHNKFFSLGKTVCIPLGQKTSCENKSLRDQLALW